MDRGARRFGGHVRGCALDVFVAKYARGELLLRLGEGGARRAVQAVHAQKHDARPGGVDRVARRHDGEEDAERDGLAERVDGDHEAGRSGGADADGVDDAHDQLDKEDEEEDHEVEGGVGAERLVQRPEPAEERERREEDHVEHGEAEVRGAARHDEDRQAAQEVEHQHEHVEDPQVVDGAHYLLEFERDVDPDVLIEAGRHAALFRQRRPVVGPRVESRAAEGLFPGLKFGRLLFEFLLTLLQLRRGDRGRLSTARRVGRRRFRDGLHDGWLDDRSRRSRRRRPVLGRTRGSRWSWLRRFGERVVVL